MKTYIFAINTHFAEYIFDYDEKGGRVSDDAETTDRIGFGELSDTHTIVAIKQTDDVESYRAAIGLEYRVTTDKVLAIEIVNEGE